MGPCPPTSPSSRQLCAGVRSHRKPCHCASPLSPQPPTHVCCSHSMIVPDPTVMLNSLVLSPALFARRAQPCTRTMHPAAVMDPALLALCPKPVPEVRGPCFVSPVCCLRSAPFVQEWGPIQELFPAFNTTPCLRASSHYYAEHYYTFRLAADQSSRP